MAGKTRKVRISKERERSRVLEMRGGEGVEVDRERGRNMDWVRRGGARLGRGGVRRGRDCYLPVLLDTGRACPA